MEFQLSDENIPLNVELRPCIESHFKCTIINVKIVFRLGFGVKIQNLPGARCKQLMCFLTLQRRKCTTKFEISWMHRSAWLESNVKVQFHLSAHSLRRFWFEDIKFSSRPPRLAWPTANWICDEISREIFLSSIRFSKAVYLRWINTDKSLFVIFN